VSHEISPLGPGEELIDWESFQRLHTGIRGPEPGWHPAPLPERNGLGSAAWMPLHALHRPPQPLEPMGCLGRPDVEQVAVGRARAHADAVALFHVRRGAIQLACCDPEPPRPPGAIESIARECALAAVLERRQPYCGAPGRDALTRRILRCLGREAAREIALVPICVGERLVALLYADAGGRPFAADPVAALSSIGADIAAAYARLIIERKRKPVR
jgi:hypothetical protein